MKIQQPALVCLSLTLFVVATFVVSAQEKRITTKEVPAAVLKAFHKDHPKAKIRGYAKETEKGKTYFEIESMTGRSSLDMLYLADGTVVETEEGLTPSDLPSAVRDAVSAKYPDAKIPKAEKTTRGNAVTYELTVMSGKTRIGMVVDPAGKIVKESKHGAKKEKEGGEEGEED